MMLVGTQDGRHRTIVGSVRSARLLIRIDASPSRSYTPFEIFPSVRVAQVSVCPGIPKDSGIIRGWRCLLLGME